MPSQTQVYFERVNLSMAAVSFDSLLPELLDRSSTRPYSSSISPMEGVRAPSRSSASASCAAEGWCLGCLPQLEAVAGGGLAWALGGFPRSADRWVCGRTR